MVLTWDLSVCSLQIFGAPYLSDTLQKILLNDIYVCVLNFVKKEKKRMRGLCNLAFSILEDYYKLYFTASYAYFKRYYKDSPFYRASNKTFPPNGFNRK